LKKGVENVLNFVEILVQRSDPVWSASKFEKDELEQSDPWPN